ncbi:hypothetical protein CKO31_25345 [Thiohalocapsa halophila]|uniref:Uncharacterized protein n=1 Tax=Thiohalocapsa halophila TaxID=69359 RepID=A0ABS1CQL3_9GAMM|nr:hypothetical protein [Thiohalocapsa halophila]
MHLEPLDGEAAADATGRTDAQPQPGCAASDALVLALGAQLLHDGDLDGLGCGAQLSALRREPLGQRPDRSLRCDRGTV